MKIFINWLFVSCFVIGLAWLTFNIDEKRENEANAPFYAFVDINMSTVIVQQIIDSNYILVKGVTNNETRMAFYSLNTGMPVPMPGEKWTIGFYQNGCNRKFIFLKRV